MFFVIFIKPVFPVKHIFKGLVIQGGSRRTNLLVSFETKLVKMFKNISVNVLTCQLGSLFRLRCCAQGKVFMLLLMAAVFVLLKCQIPFSKGGGGGILKLTLHVNYLMMTAWV